MLKTSRAQFALALLIALNFLAADLHAQQQQHKSPDLDEAFNLLYNFQFAEGHRAVDLIEKQHPGSPMASATRAALYLFSELDRLNLLASEFFQDRGDRLKSQKLQPDPAVRDKFFAATKKTREDANKVLEKDPVNKDALFALSTAAGLESDYLFFVEKKRVASLKLHKESHNYCRQLLEIDPDYPDAYLTSGFYEYLVGDLPFFMKWFIRFDGVEGDKAKGIERLQFVAEHARYSAGFAKVLLAAVYLREDRPAESVKMLAELAQTYPKNHLFPREARRLCEEHKLPLPRLLAAQD